MVGGARLKITTNKNATKTDWLSFQIKMGRAKRAETIQLLYHQDDLNSMVLIIIDDRILYTHGYDQLLLFWINRINRRFPIIILTRFLPNYGQRKDKLTKIRPQAASKSMLNHAYNLGAWCCYPEHSVCTIMQIGMGEKDQVGTRWIVQSLLIQESRGSHRAKPTASEHLREIGRIEKYWPICPSLD